MGKVEIKIGAPCSEKWESFENRGANRFCGSCAKEVIDFTRMSDREIQNYFRRSQSKICGRMRKNQQKVYAPPLSAFPKHLTSALIAGSALFFTGTPSMAQSKAQLEQNVRERLNLKHSKDEKPRFVRGTVTDDSHESLPGVHVVVKGTTNGVATDLDGNYKIEVPEGSILVFSYVGWETQEVEVGGRSTVDVTLGGVTELGEIVMGGVSSRWYSPRGLWWRVRGLFRSRR